MRRRRTGAPEAARYSAATSRRSALSTTIGVSQSWRRGGEAQRFVTVATHVCVEGIGGGLALPQIDSSKRAAIGRDAIIFADEAGNALVSVGTCLNGLDELSLGRARGHVERPHHRVHGPPPLNAGNSRQLITNSCRAPRPTAALDGDRHLRRRTREDADRIMRCGVDGEIPGSMGVVVRFFDAG